ncbi:hypothetical protein COT97_00925 [Candidatus Falkowbacteria bacterium CG10_big_fil_rev_8_21_14_0_10_39_11]|uniref:Uncharacterized protein n=1 Tax=Candidatus Falkowbacteria bacterium CG10_big_fil_rev_8_21_14_0_10_39_11 TaxID=1974565 RepID=A0A2H0V5W2_9BACT|nr:MAG: hypothetical protein COT97_00925 [Candidatus Falkowbacteria bacterium CG10_big_fil_rev_8_21_14_0_10_39_11]
MTPNIFEQFNIEKDFKLADPDHQRQYLELLRKVEIFAADRSFEELNDDIEFMKLVIELLDNIKAWIDEEVTIKQEEDSGREIWDYNKLQQWVESDLGRLGAYDYTLRNFDNDGSNIIYLGDRFDLKRTPITTLPPNLHVIDIFLEDCAQLSKIPSGMSVKRAIVISNCPKLKFIGQINVDGDLHLNNLPDVKFFNDDSTVKGIVYIYSNVPQKITDQLDYMQKTGKIGAIIMRNQH